MLIDCAKRLLRTKYVCPMYWLCDVLGVEKEKVWWLCRECWGKRMRG